jgi:hypothetical protein
MSTGTETRKSNLAARREKARTLFKTVWLADDLELAGQIEELQDELRSARLRAEAFKEDERAQSEFKKAQEAFDTVLAANRDNYSEFKFYRIGYKAYDELVKQHPPTDEQYEQAKKLGMDATMTMPWNPETFMPALILLSMRGDSNLKNYKQEEFDVDLVDLEEGFTLGEIQVLFTAAIEINTVGINLNRHEMGKGFQSIKGSKK